MALFLHFSILFISSLFNKGHKKGLKLLPSCPVRQRYHMDMYESVRASRKALNAENVVRRKYPAHRKWHKTSRD